MLRDVKQNRDLASIPVVVLTTSRFSHANCYVTKAPDCRSFERIMSSIESFWFTNAVVFKG